MFIVRFYVKGKSADTLSFDTLAEACAFKQAMMLNSDCEGVFVESDNAEESNGRVSEAQIREGMPVIQEYDERIYIYPFEAPQRQNESDENFKRRTAIAGNICVTKKVTATKGALVSCNFMLPDRSLTPEEFSAWSKKVKNALDKAENLSRTV